MWETVTKKGVKLVKHDVMDRKVLDDWKKFSIIHRLELDFVGVHLQSLFYRSTQISFILVSPEWVL